MGLGFKNSISEGKLLGVHLFVKRMSKFIKMIDGNTIHKKLISLISRANVLQNQFKLKIKKQIDEGW